MTDDRPPGAGTSATGDAGDIADVSARLKDALTRFLGLVEPLRITLWDERGLTVTQLRLLFAVRDGGGGSTGEVGAAIGLGGSSLTGLIDRVEALGFVRREPDAQDRRVTRLLLTEAGDTLLAEIESQRDTDIAVVLAGFSPDRRRLLAELFGEFIDAAEALARRRDARDTAAGGPDGRTTD